MAASSHLNLACVKLTRANQHIINSKVKLEIEYNGIINRNTYGTGKTTLINSSFFSPKTVIKMIKAEGNTSIACIHSPETKQSRKANTLEKTSEVFLKIKTVSFLSHKGLTDSCKHTCESTEDIV